mmetsp:Transcript_28644/g.62633  ORF Transcript_28644/g.62633 Transcript_28644/m.62633 type:complete len:1106 (+) Transcript_28644:84-3401(+)
MSAGAVAVAEPLLFWLCALLATSLGTLLALLETSELKDHGTNPTSHLGDCADSADLLFSDLLGDGPGLGLLEPLWRLFTPDGALWTLLTGWSPRDHAESLGLGGLVSAGGALLAAAGQVLGRLLLPKRWRKGGAEVRREGAAPARPTHEKIKMNLLMEVHAYWGYFRLFMVGVVREYFVRFLALVFSNPLCQGYVNREKWSSGWVEFYLQHMYKDKLDCFSRPIASAPDASVDVIKRVRSGGTLLGPLNDFKCTAEVQRCANLSSYNYLGFGGVDEFCTPTALAAAMEHGFSAGGTRSEGGTLPLHLELEREVASYLGKEDAMVLGMGFATNSTVLPALFEAKAGGRGVLVLSDELNHRSIVEGVRLSGATVRAFGHNDMEALEAELQRAVKDGQPGGGAPWRKVFIVVEGIYSMEGDFCRLREIVTLKNRYKAYLYLDEAHSIGAVGPSGRGVTELFGVPTSEVEVMMGTFTKSFGSAGGYVASSREVINALRRSAPGSLFASAMSPPCAAQALKALRVISGSEGGAVGQQKLAAIRENANFFRRRLEEEGFKVLGDVDSPIVPVMLHHPHKLGQFSRMCFDRGVAVVVVGYPAVPVLYERVRFCLSAAHTREQLEKVIMDVTEIGAKIGALYEKAADQGEAAAQKARCAEYDAWIRSAALEVRGVAVTAQVAEKWQPEALAPAAPAAGGLSAASLEAVTVARAEPTSSCLDLRVFDPLGYTARPLPAAQQAIEATMHSYGFGACGPRGFYGTTRPHLDLEAALVKFLATESAITYSAGVATASSVVPALVQNGDHVIVDSEVFLGVKTGLRLCRAEVTWVPHGDVAAIEAALTSKQEAAPPTKQGGKAKGVAQQRRTFLVTEAVCQRTGRLAPLRELVELKEKHGALLVLDETISFGALGAHGRGLTELCGIDAGRVDAIVGSLEHAVAGVGGFCAGRRGLVEHQRLAGAGYCFSASCPPSACASASAHVEDLAGTGGGARLESLHANTTVLHQALLTAVSACSAPIELTSSPESFVQQLRWTGEEGEQRLLAAVEKCKASGNGVLAQVCAPSLCAAEGSFGARIGAPEAAPKPSLRLCASALHEPAELKAAAATLIEALATV